MVKQTLKRIFQVLNVVFISMTLIILLITIFKKEWIEIALEWIEIQVKSWGNWNFVIIFLTSMIESLPFVGTVVPGMTVMILVGGFFVANNPEFFFFAWLIAAAGAGIGNYLGFALGQYTGRDFLKNHGYWFGIGETEMKYLEKAIDKLGFWFIVLGKFHNILRAFIPYIAGAAKMKTDNFWKYNTFGSLVWSASILALGFYGVKHYETILKYFAWILLGGFVIFILYMMKFQNGKLKNYISEKNAEIEAKSKK